MINKLKAILCALVIYGGTQPAPAAAAAENPPNCANSCGFGYELLMAKLDSLEHQLLQQQLEIKTLLAQNQNRLEKTLDDKLSLQGQLLEQRLQSSEEVITKLENQVTGVVVPKLNQLSSSGLQCEKGNKPIKSPSPAANNNAAAAAASAPIRSCADEPTKKSGLYRLKPFAGEDPFEGYCEQRKFDGGWLVVQYRFDGSVYFFRDWADYKDGFGNRSGEFWLGLQTLHRLTEARKHFLVVELEDFGGKYAYAKYDHFVVGSEAEGYPLKELGSYSGTVGDALTYHKGMKFSTRDRDNDVALGSCASTWKGAWWYKSCIQSNLNGMYINEESGESNYWWHLNNNRDGLKMTRMMIKEV